MFFLLKAAATDEEIRDLYNELEIMSSIGSHPNLVNLLGACTKDGLYFKFAFMISIIFVPL